MMRRFLIAGNWKMNLRRESARELATAIAGKAADDRVEVLLCPPFPYLTDVESVIRDSRAKLGAQNSYFEDPGAFTGEVANEMLLDVGCEYVILGHSERRQILGEDDSLINKKLHAALNKGLRPIFCLGEQLSQREAGQTETVLARQLEDGLNGIDAEALQRVVLAYEPVWAIGTGVTAEPEQAEAAHSFLRKWLEDHYNASVAESRRILYGGSVKGKNAAALLAQANIDGALVGGASLKADEFTAIIEAAVEQAAA